MVLTGDAGNPAQAPDPASLAGKLLRIEQPTTVDQAPQTTALSGIGRRRRAVHRPADGSLYVTDRTPTADRLQRITKDSKVSTVWTWPDQSRRGGLRGVRTARSWSTWSTPSRPSPCDWRPTPARSPATPR